MGQVIAGGVVSTLFTVNEQVAVLPLPSLAVSVTVLLPTPDKAAPDTGACVTVGTAAQLSLTLAALYADSVVVQLLLRVKVCVAGQEMVGGVLSTRVMVKEQVAVRFPASTAVSITVLLPTPVKVVPAIGDWVTVGVLQLSAAAPLYAGNATVQLAPSVKVCVVGQVMVGGVVSTVFTINEHVRVLLLLSVAVSVTVVLPTPVITVPNTGVWLTVGVPQLSVAL